MKLRYKLRLKQLIKSHCPFVLYVFKGRYAEDRYLNAKTAKWLECNAGMPLYKNFRRKHGGNAEQIKNSMST